MPIEAAIQNPLANLFLSRHDPRASYFGITYMDYACPVDESIEVEGRVKRYINLGDWLTHFTYGELTRGQLELKSFLDDETS